MRVGVVLLGVLVTTACTVSDRGGAPQQSEPPPEVGSPGTTESFAVSATGAGEIRIGMRAADLPTLDRSPRELQSGCALVDPAAPVPDGVLAMVMDGTVARIDVLSAGARTVDGVGVGDSEARILEIYPAARPSPHKYTAGKYLTVVPEGSEQNRLVFETDGEEVTRYRAGRLPEVEWVEGCG